MKHENSGRCGKCKAILDRYPGFHAGLRAWFEAFQAIHPEGHVSCAGRGEQDQEEAVLRGASRAHYGQSAHNLNCALDIFEMQGDQKNIYENYWFKTTFADAVRKAPWIEWYGEPGASFPELPHIEVRGWRAMKDKLKLVE